MDAVVFSWVHQLRRFAVLTAAFVAGLALAVSPLIVRNWLVGVPVLQFAVSGGYGYALRNAADSEPFFFPEPPASFLPLMATTSGRFSKAVWGCLRSFPSAGEFLRLRWIQERNFAALTVVASAMVILSHGARWLERNVVFSDRDPSSVMYRPVEFNVATATYERRGQFREASQELLQLAQVCNDPALRADTWMRAARLQIQAGDAAAARVSLHAAVEVDTTKPVSLFLLGDTWAMLGDIDNARAAHRRQIELVPNGPYADGARTRLRSLPASPIA